MIKGVSFTQSYTALSVGACEIREQPVKVVDVHDFGMSGISLICLLNVLKQFLYSTIIKKYHKF